jgi:formylglycine-generating enzyme required for sulfatase activity
LPTEAEWEKAARGGLSGQRFPWADTISESQANYHGATGSYAYDLGPLRGMNEVGFFDFVFEFLDLKLRPYNVAFLFALDS